MKRLTGLWVLLWTLQAARAAEGESVVVVFNKNLPESRKLAEYYAAKRGVPARQLFGVNVSHTTELMSRREFQDKLQEPLFDWLVSQKLFTLNKSAKEAAKTGTFKPLADAKIRYVVLSYGIPLAITRDPLLKEEGTEQLPETVRGRNEASVDADLAILPLMREKVPLTGPLSNPFYLATNAAPMHPTNNLLIVARLDGPTVEIARGLIDKALEAEKNGLWGRAYIDSRGLTDGEYKMGDDWMRISAEITRRLGFETALDARPMAFASSYPMSHIAFYAGWYEAAAMGPFTRPQVEFMPGAFAYHLHSFSAQTVRSTTANWVGPLLARGATITMGTVSEPYLPGTPNIAAFLDRLGFRQFTFGEAAYASQASLSWQTTVIGDPLYRPFGQRPDQLHFRLEQERSPLVEWSHLRVVNLNLAIGTPPAEVLGYLRQIPTTTNSSVVTEKIGDLLRDQSNLTNAIAAYHAALKLDPSPMQKLRLLLTLGDLNSRLEQHSEAIKAYTELVAAFPDYSNLRFIYEELASLSEKAGKPEDTTRYLQQAASASTPK